jgi:hypothetical protein
MKAAYEVIVHGVEHSQYWQGIGVHGTDYCSVVTGIGNNAKEAYLVAVDHIYQICDQADRLRLPFKPRGIRQTDHVVPLDTEDWYCYCSVLFNCPE